MQIIKISKSSLQKIYNTMSVKEALIKLDVNSQKFYNMLDAAGIERKKKNFKRGENIKFEVTE